ncbi:MAG TPA: cache domain-containing protein [Rhodocyclaceae bacterium]
MPSFLSQLSVRGRIWAIVMLLIGGIVLGSVVDVVTLRATLWHEKEDRTRQLVESGHSVLAHFHALQVKGELSEAAARTAAISAIKAMRYNKGEYFWLNDVDSPPKMIMHPIIPALDGKTLEGVEFNRVTGERIGNDGPFTPTDGHKNLLLAFVDVVNRGGQGYVTYDWPKPSAEHGYTEQRYPKLSYVKKFEPWGLVIGSGIYIDDVDAAVREQVGRNVLLAAGLGIVLLLFAALIARSITQPLRQTVTAMHAFVSSMDGKQAPPQPWAVRNEITELADGFKDMLGHLAARDAELARHREYLEEEVARRTAELRESNAHLAAEQKEIEALLAKMEMAQNQLLQSEKMAAIGQLAAGVAHEINNPIGFVHSNLGTLGNYAKELIELIAAYEQAAGALPDDAAARIRGMQARMDLAFIKEDMLSLLAETNQGINRVTKIVQDLKDFSHVDREDKWQPDDLHKGLDSTVNVVWNELKYKCEVRKEYGELPLVECLLPQLNQVFLNLLVNAAHAIEDKGVITLRSGVAGEQVWLEVADTGKGIPAENLHRVFEPFFTTKPVGQGTGLGLSVSYSIVEKHHGRIEVESQVGVGTTFRIWLPVRQPEGGELEGSRH